MRVAVFGGAFDPPHIGHLITISNLLNSGVVDRVLLAPSGKLRYDKSATASFEARLDMARLLIGNDLPEEWRSRVSLEVLDADDRGYTIELLDKLKKRSASDHFYVVIGSDNVEQLAGWKDSARLIAENKFIVLRRSSTDLKKQGQHLVYLEGEEIFTCDVSSTTVRSLISKNKCVAGLVPFHVNAYINLHALYMS
ncbi:MAG: nicotinate-nicotinamide nucleotide adenylyltransferase [Deltaproteobacteria bacterium]|nr:nicotinate-nicotinamide nucleotide adenylyltransferase [Deltaproteobacteria bacterium]